MLISFHGDQLIPMSQLPTTPRQQVVVVLLFLFPALTTVVFALRAYTRLKSRQWGLDDYLCGIALVLSLVMMVPTYMYVKLCFVGFRSKDVRQPYDPAPGLWWLYLSQMIYNPILSFVKASILVFLLRLGNHKSGLRWCIHGLTFLNASLAIAVFFVALLQCLPIRANWDSAARKNAKCLDKSFHIVHSYLTILTDVLVLAISLWIFLRSRMLVAAKVATIIVFISGLVVIAFAFVRLVQIFRALYIPSAITDPFYSITIVYSTIEVNLAIILASVPTLRHIAASWFPITPTNPKGGSDEIGSRLYHLNAARTWARGSDVFGMKNMRGRHHTEIRSLSPTGLEEEMMTFNGIIRTFDIHLRYSRASAPSSPIFSQFRSTAKAKSSLSKV